MQFSRQYPCEEDRGLQSRLIEIYIDERMGQRKMMPQGNRASEKSCVSGLIIMISPVRKKEERTLPQ